MAAAAEPKPATPPSDGPAVKDANTSKREKNKQGIMRQKEGKIDQKEGEGGEKTRGGKRLEHRNAEDSKDAEEKSAESELEAVSSGSTDAVERSEAENVSTGMRRRRTAAAAVKGGSEQDKTKEQEDGKAEMPSKDPQGKGE